MTGSADERPVVDGARWPGAARGAVSVTMDNMGEAFELETGVWPADVPIGHHFSVFHSLPAMLDLLRAYDVRATYFIEAWNTDVYPGAIEQVASRGHEVGLHGFRHEPWGGLDRAREEELVDLSVRRFRELGINLRGFRPPGGGLNAGTGEILSSRGIDYVSPAGQHVAVADGHIIVPFRWSWIDAFCYFEPLEEMRRAGGHPPGLIGPEGFEKIVDACIDETVESGGYASLLFHPFLHDDPDRLAAMSRILERVTADPRLWCAPCGEIAEWVRERPGMFAGDPGLVSQTWMR